MDLDLRISSYRTEIHAEVDLIIGRGSEVFAIEIKASKNIGASDLRGLRSFKEFYGKRHSSIVPYLGSDSRETDDGVEILPWQDAINRIFI